MSSLNYQRLHDELSPHITTEKLHMLKEMFTNEINSKRTQNRITNFQYLWKILERRDVIGPEEHDNLKRIYDVVMPGNPHFQPVLGDTRSEIGNSRVIPPLGETAVERIHNLIRNDIGIKWTELARALGCPEGTIDTLDVQHRGRIPDMAQEILQMHLEKYRNNMSLWRSELQQGLVSARRNDLSREIDQILGLMERDIFN